MLKINKKRIGFFFCLLFVFCILFVSSCSVGETDTPSTNTKEGDSGTVSRKEEESTTKKPEDNPSPVTYDPPIVLSFSSADSMKESAVSFASISYQKEEKPSGVYEFATVNGTDALSLRYNLFQSTTAFPAYRFTLKLTDSNAIKDDSYYVIRVTYMSSPGR